MDEILGTVGWILCCIYASIPVFWLIIHPFATLWRSRSCSPHRVLLPAWIGMWLIFGVSTAPARHFVLYRRHWTLIPAAFLLALGFWIYIQSGKGFSWIHLSGLPEIRSDAQNQTLIISGLHNHVRHPIYLGHLCEMLAWSLATGLLVCYVLMGFAVITGAFMIRMEDRELEQRFGDSYRNYRARVPAILPRI